MTVRREAITSLEELADKAKVQVWSAAALQAEAEAAAIAAEEAVSLRAPRHLQSGLHFAWNGSRGDFPGPRVFLCARI